MGKKNKTRDIWDLTPEEQAKQMEDLYAIENGDVNVLSLSKTKINAGINNNGFSHGLESEIAKDLLGRRDRVVELDDSNSSYSKHHDTELKEVMTSNKKPQISEPKSKPISIDEPSPDMVIPISSFTHSEPMKYGETGLTTVRALTFILHEKLNRIVIDDGIAPTSFSLDIGIEQDLAATYDADEIGEMLSDLFVYIISLKHPSAVYEYDDFVNRNYWKFASVKDGEFDNGKYMFFRAGDYVFCYYINKDSVQAFHDLLSEMEYEPNDMLRTYVSLAYAVGTLHQAFFVEEETYIKEFMKSDKNKQKDFHKLFTNDMSITFIPNNEDTTEDDGIPMLNLQDLQTYVREMISRITGTSYFGDDEDWDDPEDEEEYTSESDDDQTSDESYEEETGEVDTDLLSEDMEVVEEATEYNIDKIDASDADDDDFIVDVVRKK